MYVLYNTYTLLSKKKSVIFQRNRAFYDLLLIKCTLYTTFRL